VYTWSQRHRTPIGMTRNVRHLPPAHLPPPTGQLSPPKHQLYSSKTTTLTSRCLLWLLPGRGRFPEGAIITCNVIIRVLPWAARATVLKKVESFALQQLNCAACTRHRCAVYERRGANGRDGPAVCYRLAIFVRTSIDDGQDSRFASDANRRPEIEFSLSTSSSICRPAFKF